MGPDGNRMEIPSEEVVAESHEAPPMGDDCPGRHCWVTAPADGGPARPALLLEWRREAGD